MFHNIFSKKREIEEERVIVIVDFREKNSLVPSELKRINIDIVFKSLPVADYVIKEIALERKTVNDLKSSIIDKRIFTQLRELSQFKYKFLIIEGDKEELLNNRIISSNAVRGFIISTQVDFEIPLIFSNNEKDTANYIRLIINKKKNNNISFNPKKISLNIEEQKQYILESFPNIGPTKAKKLIEKFNSLKNIFNANEEELKEILGNKAKNTLALVNHLH